MEKLRMWDKSDKAGNNLFSKPEWRQHGAIAKKIQSIQKIGGGVYTLLTEQGSSKRLFIKLVMTDFLFPATEYRHPFVITPHQLGIAIHVHQLQIEAQARLQTPQGLQHHFAQMAAFPTV